MGKQNYTVPESKKVRYIIHTDCKNEADDQYTLAHCLLTPRFEVRGIIAAHFEKNNGRYKKGQTTKASYDEIIKITDLMNLRGRYPVLMGATHPMQSTTIPAISEGAKFIVKEAMKKDERPLYRITGSFD